MKDSGSAFRDMTEQEKEVFQDVVDELYLKFLEVVHQKRKDSLSLDEIKKIADGRIYTASQAHELKLIDEIGYFDTALKKALSLSSLKEANVVAYTYYPARKTNIYATNLENPSLFENRSVEDLFRSLKSGFYYLWLPQISR
jgi:protease-4